MRISSNIDTRAKNDAAKTSLVHEFICKKAPELQEEEILPKIQKAYYEHGLSADVYVTVVQYINLAGIGKPVLKNVPIAELYKQIMKDQQCEVDDKALALEIYARCLKQDPKTKRLIPLGGNGDAGKLFSYKVVFASKVDSKKMGYFADAIPFKKQTFSDMNPLIDIEGYSRKTGATV